MMGCHTVTRDEITKLEEFTTLSDQRLQPGVYMETVDLLLWKNTDFFKKTSVSGESWKRRFRCFWL